MTEQQKLEEWYLKIKPYVEEIKTRYPVECNIEGLEPALTQDISQIVRKIYTQELQSLLEEVRGMKIVGHAAENIAKDSYGFVNVELSEKDVAHNKGIESVEHLITNLLEK